MQGGRLNWWELDPNLQATVAQYCSEAVYAWAKPYLSRFGALCAEQISPRADYTDRQEGRPRLVSYDRQGNEISQVVYNPGYLQTVADAYGAGIVNWRHRTPEGAPAPVPPAVTYAMGYLVSMAETGFYCPVTLTASCALVVERFAPPELRERYLPHLIATDPDQLMQGATWLTEKTGGSDVGAITTVARQESDGTWRLTGEKWFASNCDAPLALALARPEGAPPGTAGLALFLVPRTLPGGERNSYRIRRLKDKLGVIAVPSGEVLLEGAMGYLVGGPGTGFKQMMEAINLSRVMNAIGSAGVARRAFMESAIYTSQRMAFGKPLTEHPLMRARLLEMLVDAEACTSLAFNAADRFESGDPIHRLVIPLAKARTADRSLSLARTAIECHGGNGFIEEYVTPRLLRDAQVLTVWEGPENVLALDVLRVLAKQGPGGFVDEVQGCLAKAASVRELDRVRAAASERLGCFLDGLSEIARLDEAGAQVRGVRLLNLMADVLTAAYLLAEAAAQPRKVALAQLYVDRWQMNTGWRETLLDRLALEQFDTIMAEAFPHPAFTGGEQRVGV